MGRIVCDADALATQNTPGQRPTCHTCLDGGQRIGLSFTTFSGSISFVSVLALLLVVGIRYRRYPGRGLFRSHLDVYMLNLFIGELLMSLGGVLDAKWANEAQVYCGGFCNAQGSLRFLGSTSVSLWTLAITLHTGWSVVQNRRVEFSPRFVYGVVVAVWAYVFGFNFGAYGSVGSVGDESPTNFFAPTPFWCWVNSRYAGARYGEYIWLWLAGVGNLGVYIPLFLLLRGNIVLGRDGIRSHRFYWRLPKAPHPAPSAPSTPGTPPTSRTPLTPRTPSTPKTPVAPGAVPTPPPFNPEPAPARTSVNESLRSEAAKCLYYAIAYTILVLPLSVVRWMAFANAHLREVHLPDNTALATATLVANAVYRLSGIVNVGLVVATRPGVLSFGAYAENDEEAEGAGPEPGNAHAEGDAHQMRERSQGSQSTGQAARSSTGFGGPSVPLDRYSHGISEER